MISCNYIWSHLFSSDGIWLYYMLSDIIWCNLDSSDLIWCHPILFYPISSDLILSYLLSQVICFHMIPSDSFSSDLKSAHLICSNLIWYLFCSNLNPLNRIGSDQILLNQTGADLTLSQLIWSDLKWSKLISSYLIWDHLI